MANASRGQAEDDPFTRMVRQEAEHMCTEIDGMDAQEAQNKLLHLCSEWEIDNDLTADELLHVAFRNFRWTESEATRQTDYGMNHLLRVIQLRQSEAMTLMETMKKLDMLEDDFNYSRIKKILEKVFHCMRLSLSVVQLKIAGSTHYSIPKNIDNELGCLCVRFRWIDEAKVKDIHVLIWYLLDVAFDRGYRKQGSNLFKPIVIDGYNTHAYERECDIKTFVHTHCRREVNVDAHVNLLKVSINTVVDYLENNVDIQLPFLDKDRTVFSFRNGLYTCRDDTWHPYGTPIPDDLVAANYFDVSLDHAIFERDWREIPTPNIEKIFMDQKMPTEVRQWFYVMAGRMLYPLNERDGWQVVPFLLGVAGSGKSTITDMLIGNIYDRAMDVGVLSNNCERQWAVSGLINSLIWVCPEVKDDFSLEQAIFQSMVSGESISVAEKFKTPYSTRFSIPGFLSGNVLPAWQDHGGSIARRLLIFRFDQRITSHDTNLGAKIREEIPTFIVKANKAYHEMSSRHGTKNIWTVLPQEFKDASEASLASLSILDMFLRSSHVTFEENAVYSIRDFNSSLHYFVDENHLDAKTVPRPDAFGYSLSKFGCHCGVATVTRPDGTTERMDIVVGVRLKMEEPLPVVSFEFA